MSTEIPIPTSPLTRAERADAIASRIRLRYPNVETVSVTTSAPYGSVAAGTYLPGSYRIEFTLADGIIVQNYNDDMSTNQIMTSLFASYAVELGQGALAYERSVDVTRARDERLDAARTRARLLVTHAGPSITVRVDDLAALLDAADQLRDGATPAEIAAHEDEVDRSVAEHEEFLGRSDVRGDEARGESGYLD